MSRFVRGVQIWDRDAVPRQSAQLESSVPVARSLGASLDAHVKRALAGASFEVALAGGEEVLDCVLAPLVDPSGNPDGAIAVALDAAERRGAATKLRERLAFQELITSLSTQLVSLSFEAVDEGVRDALRAIGEFAGVDRAYVFRFTRDGSAMNNTHEWCADGIVSLLEMMQDLPLEAFPWWTQRLLRDREPIHAPDVRALPPEAAAERESLIEQGVKSLLALPMIYEEAVVGFLGFDAVRVGKTWPAADVALLRIAGEIVVSALERKAAEERRRSLEAQLIQARSLENVARLAGGVAHDFNNLLAVILNYASLLRSELTESVHREHMDELYDAARRAADLTRQLLLVGRRAVDEPVLLDPNTTVASLSALLTQVLGESIELRLSLGEEVGLVRVGLPQLEQIVLNLTMNARDAMLHGGVLVVETAEIAIDPSYAARFIDLKPDRYVRLRVTDTGSGMTAEVASRAFEPFFTTKESKGTGLGLSTVYGVVKQAGGHVALSSEPGKGTTVDVFLPVACEGVVADAAPPEVEEGAPKGRGEQVLVVEDSAALRRLVCHALEANGYRTLQAAGGGDALVLLAQHRGAIDLLLTDVIMPQMSGRDLASRARDEYGVTRVLFISGYPEEIIVDHGVLEPGTNLLQKPFLTGDLLHAVRAIFDAH